MFFLTMCSKKLHIPMAFSCSSKLYRHVKYSLWNWPENNLSRPRAFLLRWFFDRGANGFLEIQISTARGVSWNTCTSTTRSFTIHKLTVTSAGRAKNCVTWKNQPSWNSSPVWHPSWKICGANCEGPREHLTESFFPDCRTHSTKRENGVDGFLWKNRHLLRPEPPEKKMFFEQFLL